MASDNHISIVVRFQEQHFITAKGFGFSRFLACSSTEGFPDAVLYDEGNSPQKCYFKACGMKLPTDNTCKWVLLGYWEKDNRAMENIKKRTGKSETKLMLRVEAVRPAPIETEDDMVEYLVSLGSSFKETGARRLCKLYGKDTIELLRDKPNKVSAELKGYSQKSVLSLSEKIKQDHAVEEVSNVLEKYGIPTEHAEMIVEKYGKDGAAEKVDADPFRVSRIRGYSFKVVDDACMKYGFTAESRQRLSAAVLSIADNIKRSYGDVCAPVSEFKSDVSALLLRKGEKRVRESAIDEALQAEFQRGSIVEQAGMVYVQDDYTVEKNLSAQIARFLVAKPRTDAAERLEEAISIRQNDPNEVKLAARQEEVLHNLLNHLLILSGGPGSGKTTAAKAVISVAEQTYPGIEVTCMAPTGKAAGRMKESTGHPAHTIHRKLGISPRGDGGRRLVATHKLSPGLIVIDEFSMVDMHLAEALLEAMPNANDYIVVIIGDVDQLPSIGPGSVLRDLIVSKMIPVTMLDVVFRQGHDSSIVKNSQKIKAQDPDLEFDGQETYHLDAVTDDEGGYGPTQRLLVRLYERSLELYGQDEVIMLTPRHYTGNHRKYAGELCSDSMNEILRERLNPPSPEKKELKLDGRVFREHDRVMQTNRNNKNINNGEIGVIESIVDTSEPGLVSYAVTIQFDSEKVVFGLEDMKDVEHGYAISIHKSQGSEYKCAIIPVLMYDKPLLTRNLLYTALSRAKQRAVFVGDKGALAYAITQGNPRERHTLLAQRIRGRMKRIADNRARAKAKAEAAAKAKGEQLSMKESA